MNHSIGGTPACLYAEAALLGAVLLAPQRTVELLDGITTEHVTHPRHQAVFEAVHALQDAGVAPEPVAVLERLRQTAKARPTGLWSNRDPAVVLAELMEAVTIPSAASYWRDLVIEYAWRRRLITAAARLDQAAREASTEHLAAIVHATRRQLAGTTKTTDAETTDGVEMGMREAA